MTHDKDCIVLYVSVAAKRKGRDRHFVSSTPIALPWVCRGGERKQRTIYERGRWVRSRWTL